AEDSAAWRDPSQSWLPPGAWDAYRYGQGGFRMDWTPNRYDTLTLQGDFLSQREMLQMLDNLFFYTRSPEAVYSNNFVARWTRKIDEDRDWSVQMYYDGFKRQATGYASRLIVVNTFDLDSQYHFKMGERHDVVCGLGYRNYASTVDLTNSVIDFDPTRDAFSTISWFVQDTVALSPDRLYLTGGIKLEENNFTGFEFQPSVRLLVTPDDRTSIWGAISRAVRTPSISERDIDIFGGFVRGNQNLVAEDLMAYELGIRRQPTDKLYWDLAVFYNHYNKLIGSYPVTEFESVAANIGTGDSYGYELVVTYEVNPDWRLSTGYSFLVENVAYGPVGTAFNAGPGYNPRNQCYLHSAWNLSRTTHLDMIWRYVDTLAVGVPHYLVMDVRLAWEPRRGLEFAVVGQNLLEKHHLEFFDFSGSTEVPAGVYGMVTWRH
ncbi:MAG: TonB-dependent receptor, partial [Pirellulaceae bacterium]|nr:TonB-dependent receptor [Pirellulaceae bacterium]